MAKVTKITLEDQGQDFLELYVDEHGIVMDAQPFQSSIWKGALIPIKNKKMFKVGVRCPIHHPPCIIYGFLKYLIEKIEVLDDKNILETTKN